MQYGSLIDLHIHSTASDGSYSPFEILTLAQNAGVTAISITDHDTISGIKQILKHPLPDQPDFITGVEISCSPPDAFRHLGSIHLLGYGFSVYDKKLNAIFNEAKHSREQRNPQIIEKLRSLGFDITIKQVEKRFGANQTGRPHIAELMKELGYVESFREAFDKYLGKGKPAYVDKFKVSCETGIQAILDAGGVPVLAHPGLLSFAKSGELEDFVDMLTAYGLKGIEVYYTDHDENLTAYLQSLAEQKKLLVTGGSDFHGSFNLGVELGKGKNNLNIDAQIFTRLIACIEDVRTTHCHLDYFEKNLGYFFKDRTLLENAFCHRSYLNENQNLCDSDNERLEFLGDAVLGLCIGHLLMEKSPTKKEGELSKLRSSLVSEPALADMARLIDLGRYIRLGKGESLSRGFEKNSILSDAFEAVIAAIYLDGGFNTVYALIRDLFSPNLGRILSNTNTIDYKSMLQEFAQEKGETTPQYEVLNETGPDHDKTFEIATTVLGTVSCGIGKTKKAAEQASARNALEILKQIDS